MKKEKNNSFALRWKTTLQSVFFLMITAGLLGFFVSGARAESVPQVEVGLKHSCVLSESGNVYCWGADSYGQLGDNYWSNAWTPVQVLKGGSVDGDNDGTYLSNIKSITSGDYHTCAVSNNNNVYCWGYNVYGQLGDGSTTSRYTPVQVLKGAAVSGDNDGTYLSNMKSISAGRYYTCAVSNNNRLYCWGRNDWGQLGDGSDDDKTTPVRVVEGEMIHDPDVGIDGYHSNIKSVSAGDTHTCAVSNNNNIYCWGANFYGQLGDNSTTSSYTPVWVFKGEAASGDTEGTFLTNINSIVANQSHTCAVSNNNNVYCWGWNRNGQLGDNSTTNSSTPVRILKGEAVSGDNDGTYLTSIDSISGGQYQNHNCAVSNNGNIYCWGDNNIGQLGDNSTTDRYTPVRVLKGEAVSGDNDGTYLTSINSVSAGESHTCATSNNNNAYCWGSNSDGILGNDGWSSYTPVRVLGVGGSGYLELGGSVLAPTISGCDDGHLYFDDITPIIENGTATLNGNPFTSGITITEEGSHTIVADNGSGTIVSSTCTILKNKTVYDPDSTKMNEDYTLGIIDTGGAAASTADEATIKVNYTLISNSSSLYIPRNTIITSSEEGTIDITKLTTLDISQSIHNENSNSKGAIKIGIPNQNLAFSQPVTVTMDVQSSYNGKILTVYSKPDEGGSWTYETTCLVADSKCTFNTTHATEYTGNYEVSNSPTPTDVNVAIDAIISLTCTDSITMGTITGTGQSNLTTNEALCTVSTNNSSGYALYWQASTAYLENQHGDQITAYTPTIPDTPENWTVSATESEWGAKLKSGSTTYNSSVWGNADTYAEGKWLNISASPYQIIARTTETAQEGDNETILFGAEIGSNKFQPTGTYDVDVTVTATTL